MCHLKISILSTETYISQLPYSHKTTNINHICPLKVSVLIIYIIIICIALNPQYYHVIPTLHLPPKSGKT